MLAAMGSSRWVVLLLFAIAVQLCGSAIVTNFKAEEQRILDNILKDYDPRVRPVGDKSTAKMSTKADPPVEVSVNMFVLSISPFDEKEMKISMQMYFRQFWKDDRLKYNGENGTFPSISIRDDSKIWTPDTFFVNEYKGFRHDLIHPNQFLRIMPDGNVIFSSRLQMTFGCPMSFFRFPFDLQVCILEVESFGFTAKDIMYKWKGETPVVISDMAGLALFHTGGDETLQMNITLATGEYSRLAWRVIFKRRLEYYLLHVFIPCAFIVMVSWTALWLDRGAITARAVIGVTTLVTLAMLTSGVTSDMMTVSYYTTFDKWNVTCLMFLFAALLESIVVNYLYRGEGRKEGDEGNSRSQDSNGDVALFQLEKAASTDGNGRGNQLSLKDRASRYRTRLFKLSTCSERLEMLSRLLFPTGFSLFFLIYLFSNFDPNNNPQFTK